MIVDQIAPTLAQLDGPRSLEDLRGQPVLLLFFNLGCDGCMFRAIPVAREVEKQYPEIKLIGVHSNFGAFSRDAEQVKQDLAAHDIPFEVVIDDGHTTYDTYEAEGTPHWIYIDADGVVRRSIFGSQPNALQRLEYLLIEQTGH